MFTRTASVLKSSALVLMLGLSSAAAYAQSQATTQVATAETAAVTVQNQVNINTADAEALALALDGVGMAKARDIIAYREEHGAFKTVDELQNVRGIGKATLERNRDRILVDTPAE